MEEEGAVTVPARLLTDFVNSLPSEHINITLAPRAKQIHITCGRNEATIAGMDAADFPPIPSVSEGLSLPLDSRRAAPPPLPRWSSRPLATIPAPFSPASMPSWRVARSRSPPPMVFV